MPSLSDIQDSFASALFDVAAPAPKPIRGAWRRRAGRRFDVHRDNIANSLIGILATRYPVTRRLIGAESFSTMARLYTIAAPPRSAILLDYGDALPRFIRSLGSMPSLAYLADIAELESAYCRAYHAADVPPAAVYLAANRRALDRLTLRLHPSVSLVESRFPVVSIWETNQRDDDNAPIQWKAESALIARPDMDVEVWRLPPGGYVFLSALVNGSEFAEAAAAANRAGDFDLAASLDLLTKTNISVGFDGLSLMVA